MFNPFQELTAIERCSCRFCGYYPHVMTWNAKVFTSAFETKKSCHDFFDNGAWNRYFGVIFELSIIERDTAPILVDGRQYSSSWW